jgi:hypothetical protein
MRDNREEALETECDYILLWQIRDPRQHPFEPQLGACELSELGYRSKRRLSFNAFA